MKLNEILKKANNETTFEISGDDYAEVTVSFKYSVEPTEYEGEHVFYKGGAVYESYKIEPFEYGDKKYTKFDNELFKDLVFVKQFETKNKSKIETALNGSDKQKNDLFDEYMVYLFDAYVAPEITVPTKNYPDQRSK